jgi:hypothetical protein
MHYGNIKTSKRLQDTFNVLADFKPHSTWDIMTKTKSCAVHSDICALKKNNIPVVCKNEGKIYYYRLEKHHA